MARLSTSKAVATVVTAALIGGAFAAYHYGHSLGLRALVPGRPAAVPPGSVVVTVDASAGAHQISALIYGASAWNPDTETALHPALVRWGGNPSSRYNWVLGDAWNAAADWEFRNDRYVSTSGSASDRFVSVNRQSGAGSIITIPALGWVAKSNDNNDRSLNVPSDGGPAINATGSIAGYDPSANRARTSVPSFPVKPGPFVLNPDPNSQAVYEDEWVNHLMQTFGNARSGGVGLYAVDNEPMLWSQTHVDVHPARMGYDDLAETFLSYSTAIKRVDPTAQVIGPESWGWSDYWYSELDRGNDNFATHADRAAHGGIPLIPWFLATVRKHDLTTGVRSLDVLTVHYYPQGSGISGTRSDPTLDAARLRSTDSLWNPNYVDESWIAQPVDLIPRMKQWINSSYPGTKLGITEYNFGGGNSISAALAEADALGIFGRQDVYLANYWFGPKVGSPAAFAFEMFRNYDGRGAAFGSTSIDSRSTSVSTVSAYAAREPGGTDVMLINKRLDSAEPITLQIKGAQPTAPAQVFQYSGSDLHGIHNLAAVDVDAQGWATLTLAPASITLLHLPVG